MKHFLLLITLTGVITRDEPFPNFYYVDRGVVRETYDRLICQGGLAAIQGQLKRDDRRKKVDSNDARRLSEDDREALQECLSKLAGGANYDLSKSVRQKLIAGLRLRKRCRGNEVILSLDPNVAQEWSRQLGSGGSVEDNLRTKLLDSLKVALLEMPCGTVGKS